MRLLLFLMLRNVCVSLKRNYHFSGVLCYDGRNIRETKKESYRQNQRYEIQGMELRKLKEQDKEKEGRI